jgi:hypothetical protein
MAWNKQDGMVLTGLVISRFLVYYLHFTLSAYQAFAEFAQVGRKKVKKLEQHVESFL